MASIPLPALDVKVPQQQNPIQSFMQMKAMMQDQQLKGIQVHQAQRAADDQKKLGDLMIKHQGNLDKVIAEAPEAGVSPNTVLGLQQHAVDVKQKTADLVKSQGANAATQADLLAGAHDTVSKAPADQRPQVYQAQLTGLNKAGVDVSTMPQEYPGDEQFKMIGAVVQGHKQQVDAAIRQQEADAATLRAKNTGGPQMAAFNSLTQPQPGPNASALPTSQIPPPDQIPTGPTPSSLNPGSQMPPAGPIPSQLNPGQQLPILGPTPSPLMQQSGITRDPNTGALVRNPAGPQSPAGPMSPLDALRTVEETKQDAKPDKTVAVDKAAMDAWLAKPQNKGKDAADYEKWKAGLAPAARFTIENGGSNFGPSNGQADPLVSAVAHGAMKIQDVLSPRTPYVQRKRFLAAVIQENPSFNAGDFDIEKGVRKAFTTGKPAEELVAFNTAISHADQLQKAATAMNNGDTRALNSLGNALGVQFGSDKATNFKVISQAYTAEVNKALTAGHITDTELKKIGDTIPANASQSQITGAVNAYKGLMQGKKDQRQKQYDAGKQGKSTLDTDNQGSSVIYARDPQGVLHKAPAGSALPKGWKTETAPVSQ